MHEHQFRIMAEARMQAIQREAALQQLVREAQGTRTRLRFSLGWLRRLRHKISQQASHPAVRSLAQRKS